MTKATVLKAAAAAPIGEQRARANTQTPGQTEASAGLWESGDGIRTGIWEASPGTFEGRRDGYDEIVVIVDGKATITEPDGTSFDIEAGDVLVTPAGWTGTWAVQEKIRKVYFIANKS